MPGIPVMMIFHGFALMIGRGGNTDSCFRAAHTYGAGRLMARAPRELRRTAYRRWRAWVRCASRSARVVDRSPVHDTAIPSAISAGGLGSSHTARAVVESGQGVTATGCRRRRNAPRRSRIYRGLVGIDQSALQHGKLRDRQKSSSGPCTPGQRTIRHALPRARP